MYGVRPLGPDGIETYAATPVRPPWLEPGLPYETFTKDQAHKWLRIALPGAFLLRPDDDHSPSSATAVLSYRHMSTLAVGHLRLTQRAGVWKAEGITEAFATLRSLLVQLPFLSIEQAAPIYYDGVRESFVCALGHSLLSGAHMARGWTCAHCHATQPSLSCEHFCSQCLVYFCDACFASASADANRPPLQLAGALADGFVSVFQARNAVAYTLSASHDKWVVAVTHAVVALLVGGVSDTCHLVAADRDTDTIVYWAALAPPFAFEESGGRFVTVPVGSHAYAARFSSAIACDGFTAVLKKLAAGTPLARLIDQTAAAAAAPAGAAPALTGPLGASVVRALQLAIAEHGNAGMVRDLVHLRVTPFFDRRINDKGSMLDNAALSGKADVVLELLRLGASAGVGALQALVDVEQFRVEHLACAVALISYGALPASGNALAAVLTGRDVQRKSPPMRRLLRLLDSNCRGWPLAELRLAARLEQDERGVSDVAKLTSALAHCIALVEKWTPGTRESSTAAASAIATDIDIGSLVCATRAVAPTDVSQLALGLSDVVVVRAVFPVSGWLECEAPDGRIGFVRPDAVQIADLQSGSALAAVVDVNSVCESALLLTSLRARLEAATLARTPTRTIEQLISDVKDARTPAADAAVGDGDGAERSDAELFGINADGLTPQMAAAQQRALHNPLSWATVRDLSARGTAPYLRRVLRSGILTVATKLSGWADAELVLDCGFVTMFVGANDARCQAWTPIGATEDRKELFHRRLAETAETAVLFRHHVCHLRAAMRAPPSKAQRLYKSLNERVRQLLDPAQQSTDLSQLYVDNTERTHHSTTFPTAPAWLALTLGVSPTVYVPMASVEEATRWVCDIETMAALCADESTSVDLAPEWARMHFLETASIVNGLDAPLALDQSFALRLHAIHTERVHRVAAQLGSSALAVVAGATTKSTAAPLSALKLLAQVLGRPSLSEPVGSFVWAKYGGDAYHSLPSSVPPPPKAGSSGGGGSGGVLAVINATNKSIGAKEQMNLATSAALQYDQLPPKGGASDPTRLPENEVSANALWSYDDNSDQTVPLPAPPAPPIKSRDIYGILPDDPKRRAGGDDDDNDDNSGGGGGGDDDNPYALIALNKGGNASDGGKGLLKRMRDKLVKVASKLRAKKRVAADDEAIPLPPQSLDMSVEELRDAFDQLLFQIDVDDWAKRHAIEAIVHGNVAGVRELLHRHRASLSADLLGTAIAERQFEVAAALIDGGYDPLAIDERGTSVLALLCRCKPAATQRSVYVALLQLALGDTSDAANAAANWTSTRDGMAALHVAVAQRNHVAVGFLVGKRGVDVNVRERERGFTPLHLAASTDDHEIVSHLLRHGCNPYLVASEAQWDASALSWRSAPPGAAGTALDVARARGHKKTARLLDARQRRDQTALCRAAAARTLTAADLALAMRRSQCYLFYVDAEGRSLLHWLAATDSASLIEQLLESPEAAVLLERHDRFEMTPLDVACHDGCYDAAVALLNAGARVEPVRSASSSGPRFDFLPLFEEQVCGARLQSASLQASASVGRLTASALSGSRMRSSATAAFHAAAVAVPTPAASRARAVEALHQREMQLQRDLEQLPFFWGYMVASECAAVMTRNGNYLLRNGPLHRFVISFLSQNTVYHTFISIDPQRGLCVGPPRADSQFHASLGQLLRMHAVLSSPVVNPRWSAERARLAAVTFAAGAHLTHAGTYDYADVHTAVSRGASTVVALTSFTGRSEQELSYERGDIMLVVQGGASDHWARLMHNGRVGFAPSSTLSFSARVATMMWDFVSEDSDELSLKAGDKFIVLSQPDTLESWSFCCHDRRFGFVPSMYMTVSDRCPLPRAPNDDSSAAAAAGDDAAAASLVASPAPTPKRAAAAPLTTSSGSAVVKTSGERYKLALSSAGDHAFGDDDDDDADVDDKVDLVAEQDDDALPMLPRTPERGGDSDDDDAAAVRRSAMPPLPTVPAPSVTAYLERDDATPIAVHRAPPSSSSSHNRAEYWRDVVDTASAALSKQSTEYVDDQPEKMLEWSSALTSALQEYEAVVQEEPSEPIGGTFWHPPRCPSGHQLMTAPDSSWICDSCHDQRTGPRTYNCVHCDFDLCESCGQVAAQTPARFTQLQLSATGMRPLCRYGHAMSRALNNDGDACHQCHWRYPTSTLVLVCEPCQRVVCRRCVGEGAWWLAPVRDEAADATAARAAASEDERRTLPTGSLFTAAAYGDVELLHLEMRAGAHVMERWIDGASPLHTAAWHGHWRVLRELIDRYGVPSVDVLDAAGVTPLTHAALRGHVYSVCVLLLRGANPQLALEHTVDANVSPLVMSLLTRAVPPQMPVDDADDVPPPPPTEAVRSFAERWSAAGRQRKSHLHAHALVAAVPDSAWQCDGARLFGCWQPSVRPGDVRFVCADGCEFGLCRVCVDGSEVSDAFSTSSSSEHVVTYGYWAADLQWISMSLDVERGAANVVQSAQVALSVGMSARSVTIYLNRSLTIAVSVELRIDTSYADIERLCRDAYANASQRAQRRRQRHAAAVTAAAAATGGEGEVELPPLPSRPLDGDDNDADADDDTGAADATRRCIYVADEDTLRPFGNLALSEHGPLATDARLRVAQRPFLYLYLPHESQVDANQRRSSAAVAVGEAASVGTELSAFSWFVPSATRESAEQLLRLRPARSFLVRPARQSSQLAVSLVLATGAVLHSLLERADDGAWTADFGARRVRAASLPALLSSIGVRPFDEARVREVRDNDVTPLLVAPSSPLVALMRAVPAPSAVAKYSDLVQRVLLHGANVNAADERTSNTPLLTAAMFGNEVGVMLLLRETGRHGIVPVNVNARNELGETALHHAARLGQRRVVQSLSRRGAELEAQTRGGALPLDLVHRSDSALLSALSPELMPLSLMHLPDEVLLNLLRFLSWQDLVNVARVNRRLAGVTRDVSLWAAENYAAPDSELMQELIKVTNRAPDLLNSVIGVVGAPGSGKSTLIARLSTSPPVIDGDLCSGQIERSFGLFVSATARLCEHGAFGGIGDLEGDNFKGATATAGKFHVKKHELDSVIVCFDAAAPQSWRLASEWLRALHNTNVARRQLQAARRAQLQEQQRAAGRAAGDLGDALFCDRMHVLQAFEQTRTTRWYLEMISGRLPYCRSCSAHLSLPTMNTDGALVCVDCEYVVCINCCGKAAHDAALRRYRRAEVKWQQGDEGLRPLTIYVVANARTSLAGDSAGDLLVDQTLAAEAEAQAQQCGASLWLLDCSNQRNVRALSQRIALNVIETAAAPLLHATNLRNHRAALRVRLLARSDDTAASASATSPYALLPFAPAQSAVDAANAVAVAPTSAGNDDDSDGGDDDDDASNDGRGKLKASASPPSLPSQVSRGEARAAVVRTLLQRRLHGVALGDESGRVHARARLTGEMLCSRGHAYVRSVFVPQPDIAAASGALFKVVAMNTVAPMTVDGLALAAGDVVDVLELPSEAGGLALGSLDGRVGRFPIDVCKTVPKAQRDAAARSLLRKCSDCFAAISIHEPTLSCFECRSYVCRRCGGDLATAMARRVDWAFKSSEVTFMAETLRDIVDEKRRELPLDAPLAGVVLVLNDAAAGKQSRSVVALGTDGANVWPETRAVLCATADGRVGYLPLLALDGTARSVSTKSLRYRLAAAYHRGMCLIRATCGASAPDDALEAAELRLGDYFECHTCQYRFHDGAQAPMIICGVCRVRCHHGHQLQPVLDFELELACECGAGAGRHAQSAHDVPAAPCCALDEAGVAAAPPKRSVRVVEASFAHNSSACFFEGQILDVVEDAPQRPGFVAVRDALIFTGTSYVRAQAVAPFAPFPTAGIALLTDAQARTQRKPKPKPPQRIPTGGNLYGMGNAMARDIYGAPGNYS